MPAKWSEAYPRLPAPGGESFDAFQARVHGAKLSILLTLTAIRDALPVVTHAGVMRVVLRDYAALMRRGMGTDQVVLQLLPDIRTG